ncbi:hypothetical protein NKR23_g8939 [Pleurostoma richardsiae]|uniref:Uncharacterized protein n=1 Tax=Pleurostoma richardsiae TaxID=41990 RepID=A0AA38VCG4_9PEZI|nr:hypothetical protein NKR23_g8939 [Pleurostoma richardsiae]
MASVSLEDARRAILEDGFFVVTDPVVGERVREMESLKLPYTSEYGLDFCKTNVLDDTRIRGILESFFEWSGLVYSREDTESVEDPVVEHGLVEPAEDHGPGEGEADAEPDGGAVFPGNAF